MTESGIESVLLRHSLIIEELQQRLNDLEVLIDDLRVQLSTHSHGTLTRYG